ncbi:MAG: LicD family protein [Oscillibacter sp.]|nr:LicD family protein [Oscillibacter sp.]
MTISELQELYYRCFTELKALCDENALTLYPVGGTLLGAVLHGDFLPWDDDLDLAMPRADYEALCRLREPLRERGMILERYSCAPDFPYPYVKILPADCVAAHIKDETYGFDDELVPALDLYPIDAVGDTREEAEEKMRRVNRVKKLYEVRTTPLSGIRNPVKRAAAALIRLIPMRAVLARFDACMAARAGEKLVTRWRGPDYEKHVYGRELWFERVKLPFGSALIDCPAGYDAILKDVYGDYTAPYTYQGGMRHTAEKNGVTRRYLAGVKKRFGNGA